MICKGVSLQALSEVWARQRLHHARLLQEPSLRDSLSLRKPWIMDSIVFVIRFFKIIDHSFEARFSFSIGLLDCITTPVNF